MWLQEYCSYDGIFCSKVWKGGGKYFKKKKEKKIGRTDLFYFSSQKQSILIYMRSVDNGKYLASCHNCWQTATYPYSAFVEATDPNDSGA